MRVRAIIDHKGLPQRVVRLRCNRRNQLFADHEPVIGIDHPSDAITIELHTATERLFILADDYRQFLAATRQFTPFDEALLAN